MRASSLLVTLAALLAANLSQAQFLINELSFGYLGRLSTPDSPRQIPNYVLSGQPTTPEVLSTKLVLTPVSPGNYRGALWSEQTLLHQTWTVDVDLRASGPERPGGGGLNIWLAHDGNKQIGSSDVYTVGKFEGLLLVVDSHGNTGGMLRGFLNDGTVDHSQNKHVDQRAFGHCNFPYRNLGRPSQVKLRQTLESFKVEIDGHLCFETNKVNIPVGYNIGVTASTMDNPDSFEIFKIVVMSDSPKVSDSINSLAGQQQQQATGGGDGKASGSSDGGSWESIADEDAEAFQTSKAQFTDLHRRLEVTNHQLSALFRAISTRHQMDEKRHNDIKDLLKNVLSDHQSQLSKLNEMQGLATRIDRLETEIKGLKHELSQKITDNERAVRGVLTGHHESLSRKMVDSVPGHGKLIFVIIGTNVLFAAVYIVYKRRKTTPKKYL